MTKSATFEHIAVKPDVKDMIKKCRERFLKLHPEFEMTLVSYNKIIYEAAKVYIKVTDKDKDDFI